MASFMYTVFSMAQVASLHCSVRREISPCTCAPHEYSTDTIYVNCEGVGSFNQVFDALQNKLNPDLNIWLKITHSQLEDLETRTFNDMNIKIKNLKLNYDQLSTLPESSFRNLSEVQYLGLSENFLEEIPRHILNHMPYVATLDLGLCRIRKVQLEDLRMLKYLRHLVLVSNHLSMLEKNSLPNTISYLHLGRNNLTSLNGTLREMQDMEVLFINNNHLTSLDDELPLGSKRLMMIIAHHNELEHLPQEFRNLSHLDSLYFNDNKLVALDGVFKYGSNIQVLYAFKNKIEYLAEDEFLDVDRMEVLDLGYNYIKSLNGSLQPLKSLRQANFTNNLLEEFSLNDIRGLKYLKVIDLSYNRIEKLSGKMENIVEPDSFIYELRLEHNLIKSLDGSMMGLNKLRVLSLSHNLLRVISPDDLIGLEELEILDISHNDLQTLEETSKSFLPKLEKLDASFNNLTKLEKDFHGLPVLCLADLSNNRITSISPELVAKTRCSNHGVLNKLEILLQENPILCQDELPVLIAMMEAQEARLLGIAHCIIRQPETAQSSQIFLTPPIPLLPMMKAQIPIIPNNVMHPSPSIVQVIMPAPIILQAPSVEQTTVIPSNALPSTTISTSLSPPTPTIALPPVTTEIPLTTTVPSTSTIATTTESSVSDIETVTDVRSTVEVAPTPVSTPVPSSTIETDNSVDENFSPIPQVIGPSPDRAQQLLEPEEPPEVVHDDSLPAK